MFLPLSAVQSPGLFPGPVIQPKKDARNVMISNIKLSLDCDSGCWRVFGPNKVIPPSPLTD